MITKRLLILLAVLLVGLSCIFALPENSGPQPVGVNMELPSFLGEWYGETAEVTQKEYDVLGPETKFCRRNYFNGLGDVLFVSIVLSGQDMNTSIHRPERCLPAQGFTVMEKHLEKLPLDPRPLTVTRLNNMRPINRTDGRPVLLPNGQQAFEYNLNYYWFVGCTETTPSHDSRTWIDMRDRLVKGYNQRWAYVTVTAEISGLRRKFGRSEKETDAIIQKFIAQLAPLIQKPSVVNE